jgi:hypothetical protein
MKLPYVQAAATLECVGDPQMAHTTGSSIARALKTYWKPLSNRAPEEVENI